MQGMVPLCGFGGVPYSAVRKAAPRNLLDNSDFRNPVNQRGGTTYTDNGYTIDRWQIWGSSLTIGNGYVNSGNMYQLLYISPEKVYTFAACSTDGSISILNGIPQVGASITANDISVFFTTVNNCVEVVIRTTKDLLWAALYEGEYTAATLPEYQPKGYGAELAECQRY